MENLQPHQLHENAENFYWGWQQAISLMFQHTFFLWNSEKLTWELQCWYYSFFKRDWLVSHWGSGSYQDCVCVCVYKIFAVMYIFILKPHFSLHQLHFNGLVATWGSEMVLESIARDHQPQTFQSWELLIIIAIRANLYWALAEYQRPW